MIIIIMGVAGAGKSTLGGALAAQLGWEFIEGDDYHPPANVVKMSAGEPLNDADRWPWLKSLHERIVSCTARGRSAVLACSALKREYRNLLTRGLNKVVFVHLTGKPVLIKSRLKARKQHFMLPELLDSQFEVLEAPPDALRIPVDLSTREQVERIRRSLGI